MMSEALSHLKKFITLAVGVVVLKSHYKFFFPIIRYADISVLGYRMHRRVVTSTLFRASDAIHPVLHIKESGTETSLK